MTCAEFQKALPYIIETGGNAEQEEHLRSCAKCSDLVADLKYIAECAKLLVPMVDPSPRVWDEINKSLEQEGLVRKATPRGRLLEATTASRWGPRWLIPVAAILLAGVALFVYRNQAGEKQAANNSPAPVTVAASAVSVHGMSDADDQQVLRQVAVQNPSLRDAYESNLKQVNSDIADAQKSLDQNPDDADAQESLRDAYEQKTMLYDMATSRSLP
jgi:hypothetical protein